MHRTRKGILAAVLGVGVLALSLTGSAFAAKTHQIGTPSKTRRAFATYVAGVVGERNVTLLRADLKAGKTLLQIAEANHKFDSADALATALLAPVKARMDRAAARNSTLAGMEATVYARLHARVVKLVQTQHPVLRLRAGARKAATGLIQTMVSACQAQNAASLLAAFKAGGKTPLAVCQATAPAMTRNDLVSALMTPIKTKLDAVANSIPALKQHESQILARLQARLNTWVVTPIPAGA